MSSSEKLSINQYYFEERQPPRRRSESCIQGPDLLEIVGGCILIIMLVGLILICGGFRWPHIFNPAWTQWMTIGIGSTLALPGIILSFVRITLAILYDG